MLNVATPFYYSSLGVGRVRVKARGKKKVRWTSKRLGAFLYLRSIVLPLLGKGSKGDVGAVVHIITWPLVQAVRDFSPDSRMLSEEENFHSRFDEFSCTLEKNQQLVFTLSHINFSWTKI